MKLFASLAVLAVATIGSASASLFQYNTNGSIFQGAAFTTGNNTSAVTVVSGPNTVSLTYTGPGMPPPATVSVNTPTNISYGFITLSYTGNSASTINIPSFTFKLVVNNLTDATTAFFTGTAAASTIAANSSTLNISWAPNPLVDGGALLSINTPTSIPSDRSLNGQASIQGSVINAAPEPGSMFLLGAGLIGIGFAARKKFGNRS